MPSCKKCGAEFETGPEVGAHARDAHSTAAKQGDDVPYRCFGCDSLIPTFQEFLDHGRHAPTMEDKQAAYDRMLLSFYAMGFEARVDSKGITGYHLP